MHLIEKRFLGPEVPSLMEVQSVRIVASDLRRSILLCPLTKNDVMKKDWRRALDEDALQECREQNRRMQERFSGLATGYTADGQMRERIVRELWRKASG